MSEAEAKFEPRLDCVVGELTKLRIVAGSLATVAALVLMGGCLFNPQQAAFSYLVAGLFLLSLAVGGLFWVMLHYLTGAVWSVVLRRIMEHLASLAIPSAAVFVPLMFALRILFPWSAESREIDAVVAGKSAYLNSPFFLARTVVYFAVWLALASLFRRASLQEDVTGAGQGTDRVRSLSAIGMLLLALTTTFAAFDWIMSLDPHWYSNIFGVYFWSGSILSSLAAVTLMALAARRFLGMINLISVEHLHDLGKLLFGFTVFWAYIAFSQYFLIWYAAIPEETTWYGLRLENGWGLLSVLLVLGHFVVPFALLLPRASKRSPRVLGFSAAWLLGFHGVDLYWQVMPTLHPEGVVLHWLDAASWLLVFSVISGTIAQVAKSRPLIPQRDPEIIESIQFESA